LTSDKKRRLLGTATPISSSTFEDSYQNRLVWNCQNRVRRPLRFIDSGSAWNCSSSAWQGARGLNTSRVSVCQGLVEEGLDVRVQVTVGTGSGVSGQASGSVGLGLNSTTALATGCHSGEVFGSTVNGIAVATMVGLPALGYSVYYWLELCRQNAPVQFISLPAAGEIGITGSVMA
jgi:hypothetical protein